MDPLLPKQVRYQAALHSDGALFYTDGPPRGKSCKIRGMVAYFPSKFIKRFQAAFSVALLLFCLLGTHWIGFAHSISHAGLQSQTIEKCTAADTAGITHSSDSCHLFDALTLAGFVPTDDSSVVGSTTYSSAITQLADSVLAEPASTAYQSRAPPTFIL